ncbi:MAG: DUF373 family protein, partial [Acidilobaceae archaeon]
TVSRRPFVVIVDIDNDIFEVTGSSVIIGAESVLSAALSYAKTRSEDADLNAIFYGLSLYWRLQERDAKPEIAIVGGHKGDEVEAQLKIKERIRKIVDSLEGNVELYIVGDGLDEVMIGEILSDVAPIAVVKRIVVEQHAGIETSYVLFSRYLRKALEDPRFVRYFLGIPGLILTLLGILAVFNMLSLAVKISLIILGTVMFIRGFGLEDYAMSLAVRTLNYIKEPLYIRLVALTILLALTSASAYITIEASMREGMTEGLVAFLGFSAPLALIGFSLALLIGNVLRDLLLGEFKSVDSLVLSVAFLLLSGGFYSLGSTLEALVTTTEGLTSEVLIRAILESNFILFLALGGITAGILEVVLKKIM